MENTQMLRTDYLDIIFTNRNKSYGSYILRKNYNNRALKAIGIVLFLAGCMVVIPFVINYLHPTGNVETTREIPAIILGSEVLIPEIKTTLPKPAIQKAAPPSLPAETKRFTEPKILSPDLIKPENMPPAIDEMAGKLAGATNNKGVAGGSSLSGETPSAGGDGQDVLSGKRTITLPAAEDSPLRNPDQWPEFPGGKKALQEYLSRNIKYPVAAAEAGLEGQVVVSFVVNEAGEIADIKMIRKIGSGCEEEALRVIRAMPKWKPGIKNGRPVKVCYMLPVFFRLSQ